MIGSMNHDGLEHYIYISWLFGRTHSDAQSIDLRPLVGNEITFALLLFARTHSSCLAIGVSPADPWKTSSARMWSVNVTQNFGGWTTSPVFFC